MGAPPSHNRRCHVALITVAGLAIAGMLYFSLIKGPNSLEQQEQTSTLLPVFYRDVWPDPNQTNIYQIETSYASKLRPRFVCAVESFCAQNPSAVVWLLVTAPALDESTVGDLAAVREAHHNLRVAYAHFELILQDTPILELYKSNEFWHTKWAMIQLSDTARIAVVYKSGGFYADTDIIAVRPVGHLMNFFVMESETVVNNAVFHFQRGHPMLLEIMKHIAAKYDGQHWGAQGPFGVTATAKSVGCLKTLIEAMDKNTSTSVHPCSQQDHLADHKEKNRNTNETPMCNWTILRQSSFYPVPWQNAMSLFANSSQGRSEQPVEEIFPESWGVHLSNKITSGESFSKGSLALKLAGRSCPATASREWFLL